MSKTRRHYRGVSVFVLAVPISCVSLCISIKYIGAVCTDTVGCGPSSYTLNVYVHTHLIEQLTAVFSSGVRGQNKRML
jgi:hypothetical protein